MAFNRANSTSRIALGVTLPRRDVCSLDATVTAGGGTVESVVGFVAAEEVSARVVAAGTLLVLEDAGSVAARVVVVADGDVAESALFAATFVCAALVVAGAAAA
jgi:hypothetical protein